MVPCALLFLFGTRATAEDSRIRVLIIDGQNNHAWARTTPQIREILRASGRFAVTVSTTPWAPPIRNLRPGATADEKASFEAMEQQARRQAEKDRVERERQWRAWTPNFQDYAVVLSNYNGEEWPERTRIAFERFVQNGGGFVSFHAADNAFGAWPEYNRIIGLGGWGGRTQQSGPYLRWRGDRWVAIQAAGPAGRHGRLAPFVIRICDRSHPIMKGFPPQWLHTTDELYDSLRGPAANLTVLASAKSAESGEDEPVLFTVTYGRGRVFHITLGHDVAALADLGLQVALERGVEWAATGKVTISEPLLDQLNSDKITIRPIKLTAGPR